MFESVIENEKSLTERVADQIIQRILSQNLMIGEKLPNEFELADDLKVGRGTIRESVKLLVSRNILEIRRGKGTFVSQAPGIVDDPLGLAFYKDKYKLAIDLLQIRCILEPEIAAVAAQNAQPEEIEALRLKCIEIEQLVDDAEDYIQQDAAFHTSIAQMTRNLVMPNLIPIIHTGIELFNVFPYEVERKEAISVHREIVEAIAARDPKQACEAMIKHLSYNIRNMEGLGNRYK
ncbi:FadR/GntR family transcriptional regulator [Oscillospiraceae bacterium MB08-C2-2]|nr:FadR/GntR family transcriptional regulator [Oscillospiraceae bacterium MB08-C2-2]